MPSSLEPELGERRGEPGRPVVPLAPACGAARPGRARAGRAARRRSPPSIVAKFHSRSCRPPGLVTSGRSLPVDGARNAATATRSRADRVPSSTMRRGAGHSGSRGRRAPGRAGPRRGRDLDPAARRFTLADVRDRARRSARRRARRCSSTCPARARPRCSSRCSTSTARPRSCSPSGPRRCRRTRARSRSPAASASPSDADLVAAALREAQEEIGLEPDAVEIVGRARQHRHGRVRVHDHAVRRAARRASPSCAPIPREVVRRVRGPDLGAARTRTRTARRPGTSAARPRPMAFFELPGETVWGRHGADPHAGLLTPPRPRDRTPGAAEWDVNRPLG